MLQNLDHTLTELGAEALENQMWVRLAHCAFCSPRDIRWSRVSGHLSVNSVETLHTS
jgi:hypothetical protein